MDAIDDHQNTTGNPQDFSESGGRLLPPILLTERNERTAAPLTRQNIRWNSAHDARSTSSTDQSSERHVTIEHIFTEQEILTHAPSNIIQWMDSHRHSANASPRLEESNRPRIDQDVIGAQFNEYEILTGGHLDLVVSVSGYLPPESAQKWAAFAHEPNAHAFSLYLRNMLSHAAYRNDDNFKQANIKLIERLADDQNLRGVLFANATHHIVSCADNIAYGRNLDEETVIRHDIIDGRHDNDIDHLVDIMKSMLGKHELDKIFDTLKQSMPPGTDLVQEYLHLSFRLRDDLNLRTVISPRPFYGARHLTGNEDADIATYIREKQNDRQILINFMAESDCIVPVIKRRNPDLYQAPHTDEEKIEKFDQLWKNHLDIIAMPDTPEIAAHEGPKVLAALKRELQSTMIEKFLQHHGAIT